MYSTICKACSRISINWWNGESKEKIEKKKKETEPCHSEFWLSNITNTVAIR